MSRHRDTAQRKAEKIKRKAARTKRAQRNSERPRLTNREIEAKQMARRVEAEANRNPAEGVLVGPLAVAAEKAAPIIAKAWGFDENEHIFAVECWLTERLSECVDDTLRDPAVQVEYAAWRRAQALEFAVAVPGEQ